MKRYESFTKPLKWFMALLLVAVAAAGCNDGSNAILGGSKFGVRDVLAPTVSSTSPANGSSGVALNQKINVIFSEAMDPLTITTASFTMRETVSGNNVPGTVSPVGTAATFSPTSPLLASTNYTVTIKGATGGVKDLAGNVLASNYVFAFAVGTTADTTAPTVSATSPANTAVAVPFNQKVNVTFSEAMDPLTITTASFNMKETVSGNNVPGSVNPVGTIATFSPTSPLLASTNYTVTIKGATGGVKDLAGNVLASNYVFTFTTNIVADTTPPRVTSTINADGATNVAVNTKVGATFSEQMDPLTLTTANITLVPTAGGAAVLGTVSQTGTTITFTPNSNLAFSTQYTATVKGGTGGVADVAGNVMAVNYLWSWTTGVAPDTTAPTVILTNPADSSTNVALNSTVNATFSEAMDPTTLSTASFTVGGVTGLVNYDAPSKIVTFTPSSNFAPSTTYTASISNQATDLAGNALVVPAVGGLPKPNPWTFTTAAAFVAPSYGVALGSASTFGIMATAAVTAASASVINGDVSLEPGTSMTGFPPAVVNGSIHINDTVSHQAGIDLLAAYNYAKGLACATDVGSADLGGLYVYPAGIPPGVYCSGSTMLVGAHIVLDGGGNTNAVWVFQIGSSLTSNADVTLTGGAQAKNVFWVPTHDATIGSGTTFNGTIVAGRDATSAGTATINGRILAGAIIAGTIALDGPPSTVNVPAP